MKSKSQQVDGIDRRTFLSLSVAAAGSLLCGSWAPRLWATAQPQISLPSDSAPWIEATIPQLRAMMEAGGLTSRKLTLGYLQRIDALNSLLHAVIETNPNAVAIAAQLDN